MIPFAAMEQESAPATARVAWWKQVLGYTGVCVVEAFLAAVLIYGYFGFLLPWTAGGGEMARACGVCALIFLGPLLWFVALVVFVCAKVVVVLLPHARRHWALAVYWGVTVGFALGDMVYQQIARGRTHELKAVLMGMGGVAIAPLVLTLSHFALIPRVAPGGSALDALRALVRYNARARK